MPLPYLKKFLFIFLGILISFLIIEFSLRIEGYYFRLLVKKKETVNILDSGFLRVLCVGDSFTFGMGAKKGFSYPEQLQKLINRENMKYKVYNLGIPAMNSSMLLIKLPKWIEIYKPNIIVLLISGSDTWNFQNSNFYNFQKGKHLFIYRLERLFFNLKTYNLLRLLIMNLDSKLKFKKNK